MKFSAWQTSDRWKETTEAHNWRVSKCLEDHSVSLCWLIVPTKSLTAAEERAPLVPHVQAKQVQEALL